MSYPREPRPEKLVVPAAAARSALYAIDHNDERQVEGLVTDFLCAAWPTLLAQNQ
jgi:hypothetical protein